MTTANGTADSAAWDCLRRGWCPIPLGYKTKRPIPKEWEQLRADGLDVEALFPPGEPRNIGTLLGEPSGGLVDLDHDCPEARAASAFLAPPTDCVWGRRSASDSHRAYLVPDPPASASTAFTDPVRRAKLLEVRSTGGQTVIPPSVLPAEPDKGKVEEPCVWQRSGDPAAIALADLVRAAGRIAAAALLGRYWPNGSRHDAALALAGGLLRAGWDAGQVEEFVRAVCAAAGDPEVEDRVRAVADTAAKLPAGDNTTGWPTVAKALGEKGEVLVAAVRQFLGVRDAAPPPTGFAVGTLTIRPGAPRQTPTGRVNVPLTLWRGGKTVDRIQLTDSTDGRQKVAAVIARHAGAGDRAQVERVLAEVLAWAVDRLDRPPAAGAGETVRSIVAARVPELLKFTYRTARGLWSEVEGRELTRADVLAFVPSDLLTAAAAGVDAPPDGSGLLRAVKDALEVLWADLRRAVKTAAELAEDTAARRAFHDAIVAVWKKLKCWEVDRGKARDLASRVSLAGMVRRAAREFLTGAAAPGPRETWRPVREDVDAWWRPVVLPDGLCTVLLAMRYTLAKQLEETVPEAEDQKRFTELGLAYGVFTDTACVSGRLSDGTRLSVLCQSVTRDILAGIEDEPPDPPLTDTEAPQ